MECLPLQNIRQRIFPVSVNRITKQRMPDGVHMYSDLVGSAGFQTAFNIGIGPKTLQHLNMGDCFLSIPDPGRHLFPVCRMPSHRAVDTQLLFPDNAMNYGTVTPDNGMILQLGGNRQMSIIIFTDNQAARGIAVNTMDDAGRMTPLIPERLPRQ